MTTPLHDLTSFDRDIARAHGALLRYRVGLAKDPESSADADPLGPYRLVSGQSAYDALRRQPIDEPFKGALLAWIHALTDARVVRDLDVAWAQAATEKAAHLTLGAPRMVSFSEAWRGMVTSLPRREALAWLDAAAERGPHMASIARQRAERRVEVARRLGLTEPTLGVPLTPLPLLTVAAEAILRETDDLSRSLLREARAKAELAALPVSPVDAMVIAVARDAPEGWPAQLGSRWLSELFAPLARGLRIDLPELPAAIGASSFARALGAFGYALRVAGAARSLPFVLARSPGFVDAHRYGWVFANLASSTEFQRRVLGVSARVANAQSRVLARTSLFTARIAAARFLLSDPARPPASDRFEQITFAAFGAPLPRELRGAWPPPKDDDPARFLALSTALPLARDLVDRFDVDWFANPRATDFLRARASGPAWEANDPGAPELDAAAAAAAAAMLARAYETMLA